MYKLLVLGIGMWLAAEILAVLLVKFFLIIPTFCIEMENPIRKMDYEKQLIGAGFESKLRSCSFDVQSLNRVVPGEYQPSDHTESGKDHSEVMDIFKIFCRMPLVLIRAASGRIKSPGGTAFA